MHNHGVRGNLPPLGGWPRFSLARGRRPAGVADDIGYHNVHIGKYMNVYATEGSGPRTGPAGWDEWYGKASEDALYFNYQVIEKTGPSAAHLTFYGDQPTDYQTDVFRDRAVDFVKGLPRGAIRSCSTSGSTPHTARSTPLPAISSASRTPALPRLPGFNEKDISDKPKWFQKQSKRRLSKKQIKVIDNERRRAEEQLLSVDQAVAELVDVLSDPGILDDTYILFTSDNGFFRGEHRISSGKYLPHDPSSRVPLLIRGRGSRRGGERGTRLARRRPPDDPRDRLRHPGPRTRRPLPPPLRRESGPAVHQAHPARGRHRGGGTEAEPARASAACAKAAKVGVAGKRGVEEPRPGERDQVAGR